MKVEEKQIDTKLRYGMGAVCEAILPKSKVYNTTAENVIFAITNAVTSSTDSSEPAKRLARKVNDRVVINKVTDGDLDIEVLEGEKSDEAFGRPIELSDIVITDKNSEQTPEIEKLTLQVSESFRGGTIKLERRLKCLHKQIMVY